ncbi:MAG TPA: dihydrodipicolinate synthase family protein [Gaiellaceae bacterium]|nr:dihydrodipicolinate synthase family protein [Gaiellaceae bacterium]
MPRAIAAALTPLAEGGAALDLEAVAPYVAFLADAGIDGLLVAGTTGEGMNLSIDERKRLLEAYAAGALPVIAHCGAQTTAGTIELARHAATLGVEGVAVIAPPYFPLRADELLAHFTAAAAACAPTPFYAYELERASGYAIPPSVVEELRGTAPNLVGMKVSDAPFEKVAPYLLPGLDVFVGAEALIGEGLAAGAAGAVSGLAAALPQAVVDAVRSGDSTAVGALRASVERFPRHAALKEIAVAAGVPMQADVRPPLRSLTGAERTELLALVA